MLKIPWVLFEKEKISLSCGGGGEIDA